MRSMERKYKKIELLLTNYSLDFFVKMTLLVKYLPDAVPKRFKIQRELQAFHMVLVWITFLI